MGDPYISPYMNRPQLKDQCPLSLHRAFSDGQWTIVVNLARQRHRATKDPYFEAVEISARSQLDAPADQFAARLAIEKLVRDKVPVKDPNLLDLYDWASIGYDLDYGTYMGELRARLVKSLPKDEKACQTSFIACVVNEDWKHAQQIAASLDKHFPAKRHYLFLNILSCYILFTKLAKDDPQRALFGTLAKRMVDKAKSLRDSAEDGQSLPERAIQTEEEMLLWYQIQVNCSFKDKPEFEPLKNVQSGHLAVFRQVLETIAERGDSSDQVFKICEEIVRKGLQSRSADEKDTVDMRAYRSAAMDWTLWKRFIAAAKDSSDPSSLDKLRQLMEEVPKSMTIRAIHRKQLDLTKLLILSPQIPPFRDALRTARVEQIVSYALSHYKQVSCFDDLKQFLEPLLSTEVDEVEHALQQDDTDLVKKYVLNTLCLRIRYHFITLPRSVKGDSGKERQCASCLNPFKGRQCRACLENIATSCASMYREISDNSDLKQALATEDVDPLSDLALIGAMCLLKLSGLDAAWNPSEACPLQSVDVRRLLLAVSWLDAQFQAQQKNNRTLPVLLVQLYNMIGCTSHAQLIWETLGIKNVILDSLGPIYSDRLSSIAPGMWAAGKSRPMQAYTTHFTQSLKRSLPTQMRNALDHGSYASVIGMLELSSRLRRSCTLVMSAVEDSRGSRAVGSKPLLDITEDPLVGHIMPSTELVDVTDYASLPNHEGASGKPIEEYTSIGPRLSPTRAHLSLLSEKFLGLISFRETKDYKPTKPGQAMEIDRDCLQMECSKLLAHLSKFMYRPDTPSKLSGPELAYYRLIIQLTTLVTICTGAAMGKNVRQPDGVEDTVTAIIRTLTNQIEALKSLPEGTPDEAAILYNFSSLHANGMLRESALTVKTATHRLTTEYERARAVDKSIEQPRWFADSMKVLNIAASEANSVVKERIKLLKEVSSSNVWVDRLLDWTFGDFLRCDKTKYADTKDAVLAVIIPSLHKAIGGQEGCRFWARTILDSWQEGAKGWSAVKLD